jgi:CheY-like chemotaxis protein
MSFKKFTSTAIVEAQPWGKVAVEAVDEFIRGFLLHEAFKGCKQGRNLLETMNYKDQFLANVSHEIRTPLYAINALAELCLTKPYVPQEVREHLEMINESGTSLLGLLNDVIDVRRLDAGKLELHMQDVDVVGLARFCLKMFRKQANNIGLEGFIIYDDSLCNMNLRLDKTRMQQLIVNLVSNALKFTETGSITIRLSRDVPKNELTVLVMDTGIGIKPEHISLLFSKFSQVTNSETKLFHGAGLGLSIVKQLVDLMGGQVGVDSEYQKGSHFWFTIPAQPSTTSEPPTQPCDGEGLAAVHEEKVIEAVPPCVNFPSSPSSSLVCRYLEGEAKGPASRTSTGTPPAVPSVPSTGFPSPHRLAPSPSRFTTDSDLNLQARNTRSSWWRNFLCCGGNRRRSMSPQNTDDASYHQTVVTMPTSTSLVKFLEDARPRILVADDNVVLQKVTAKMFEDLADVTIAQNGQEVLDILESDANYVMILMDLQMPVLDGIAATKKIRENVVWDHIPVIGFTASSFSDEIAKCLAAGMSTLLTKPLPKATLNQVVDECINGKYQRSRAQPH